MTLLCYNSVAKIANFAVTFDKIVQLFESEAPNKLQFLQRISQRLARIIFVKRPPQPDGAHVAGGVLAFGIEAAAHRQHGGREIHQGQRQVRREVGGGVAAPRAQRHCGAGADTLDGGEDNDTFQIGQVYKSERVADDVATEDEFTTVLTTRGYLSSGVTFPTVIYGGTGNDRFSVYSNKAELRLDGNAGNDEFIIRAFALAGTTDRFSTEETTKVEGGEGEDFIQYNINAPVSNAFAQVGLPWAQFIISIGAVAGITSVLLVMMLSQPRVLLAMARDGLVPTGFFGDIHEKFRTPWKSTILTGAFVALMAALLPRAKGEAPAKVERLEKTLTRLMTSCRLWSTIGLRKPALPVRRYS